MTRDKLPAGLLDDVKNQLDITWDDEATDKKYCGLIAAGANYLDGRLGTRADYTADGEPRTLLMEYVRYARDSALDVFEANYLSLILGAQHERAVNQFEKNTVYAAE